MSSAGIEEETPEPWRNSDAKKTLKTLLESDDFFMNMKENDLYNLSPMLFHPYDKERFVSNVKNMKKAMKDEKALVAFQVDALAQDLKKFPAKSETFWGYKPWCNSAAKTLLQKDVQEKVHLTMSPKDLHQSKDEYKQFPLKVFRKHIYQEDYAQLGRSYWMRKKEQKKKSKKKTAKDKQMSFREMTIAQLKVELRARSLKVSGKKQELIERLESAK
jgi:hypothetical protein